MRKTYIRKQWSKIQGHSACSELEDHRTQGCFSPHAPLSPNTFRRLRTSATPPQSNSCLCQHCTNTAHEQPGIAVLSCSCSLNDSTVPAWFEHCSASLAKQFCTKSNGSLKFIWTFCFNKEPLVLCKMGRSRTLLHFVSKVQQLLCKIILDQTLFTHSHGWWDMAHSREESRWSPELCFALFLLGFTSGNLLCLPNGSENESGVKAIQMRWSDEPFQVQQALILPGRASVEAKGGDKIPASLLWLFCSKQKWTHCQRWQRYVLLQLWQPESPCTKT